MNATPFPPQDPNQPKPGQLGQPSPGQAPTPPKPPKQPWATGDTKKRWPWVVGGSFAAAILFLGIAANQHENTPTASETALASRTSAAAATLSAQQAEAKRLEQEEIKRQHEEERVRCAAPPKPKRNASGRRKSWPRRWTGAPTSRSATVTSPCWRRTRTPTRAASW
ncbi:MULTISPECIES: hypothetical protein [unclassified Rhodococcus (in: high G+C Gram-positive bacteria)]|uniref:hypothetical protein n=1 Tax=unclassified Rhodococcus (in: high G+C Gram-positive bacteria) TaxID=192944 RepID=UPI001639D5B6|nr:MULTISPECIES: hypothetical protein [unclassified Rhodococcus (in: high G+C Gram-positive bacteria)]MBC2644747.1 hypothetical protein [Rhodococcus sp. 3A]MBC2898342.1 hypothetical protein [Rhodococcus sp. 4CII]